MKAQGLQRALVMPGFVRSALDARKLREAYEARPDYQKTEYLNWIDKAPLKAGKRKRLDQMLDELEKGNVYMGEKWAPPPPVEKS
jgi:uncharacterized protein YdeI (YjbR/CyaY-like superfamily)